EAIETGTFPEWELGVQLVPESEEFSFGIDLLDATKIIPEEEVPVRPVGKMVLNRNPDNFFVETEQVAFHTANVIPGIDFTNDPLLQFRNFSYLDTQLIRLGGPNFAQLPVNRPLADVRHNQQDGYGQHVIPKGRTSYFPNSLGGGCPALADEDVFTHYTERVDGHTIRQRAKSFQDFYSQARMFWKSMSAPEAEHIVAAFAFELGKVEVTDIRSRVVEHLNRVDHDLATRVAAKLGLPAPDEEPVDDKMPASPALSQLNNAATDSIAARKIAVLAASGVDVHGVEKVVAGLRQRGAVVEVLAPVAGGTLAGGSGGELAVDRAITTMSSVLYDAVIVPCGPDSVATLSNDGYAMHFIIEAYRHLKPVGAFGSGVDLIRDAGVAEELAEDTDVHSSKGVVSTTAAADDLPDRFAEVFASVVAQHRAWDRQTDSVPA
ncbi:MAG: catalase, partial [Mycobacteriaceae bacterium]|nr:catalase [Mycobacteriaceae bacterium]